MENVDEAAIAEWGRRQKVLATAKHRSRAQVSTLLLLGAIAPSGREVAVRGSRRGW